MLQGGIINKVIHRLVKNLFGVRQAPKIWNPEVCHFLKSNGFEVSPSDRCFSI